MALQFQDSSFKQEVLESGQPVLVDFYADWCGPAKCWRGRRGSCGGIRDRIKIGKLNVDKTWKLPQNTVCSPYRP